LYHLSLIKKGFTDLLAANVSFIENELVKGR
jgi:hypothetical protein